MSECKKRKLNCENQIKLDDLLLESVFCFSSISDVIFSFQFVSKQWYTIYQSELFMKEYYSNVFKLNKQEVNHIEKTLDALRERFDLKKKVFKENKPIYFSEIPINFKHLFRYWSKLQLTTSLLHVGPKLMNDLIINVQSKDFKNYETIATTINEVSNLEVGKSHLFREFKMLTGNDSLLFNYNYDEQIIEPDLKKEIIKTFKLSKFSFDHLYVTLYNFKTSVDDSYEQEESNITFVLFLDNGIPLYINSSYDYPKRVSVKQEIKIYKKSIFQFIVGDYHLDESYVKDKLINSLVEIVFEIDKTNLQKLLQPIEIRLKQFIPSFLYFLCNFLHFTTTRESQLDKEVNEHIPTLVNLL
ncbi:hypothetical protein ABK040_015531 [Willaertia magna]